MVLSVPQQIVFNVALAAFALSWARRCKSRDMALSELVFGVFGMYQIVVLMYRVIQYIQHDHVPL